MSPQVRGGREEGEEGGRTGWVWLVEVGGVGGGGGGWVRTDSTLDLDDSHLDDRGGGVPTYIIDCSQKNNL